MGGGVTKSVEVRCCSVKYLLVIIMLWKRYQYSICRKQFCYSLLSPPIPPPHLKMIKVHIRIFVSSQTFTGENFTPLKTMPLTLFSLKVHYSLLELHLMCTALLCNSRSEISDAHALPPAWMTF